MASSLCIQIVSEAAHDFFARLVLGLRILGIVSSHLSSHRQPSRTGMVLFAFKAWMFRARRWIVAGRAERLGRGEAPEGGVVIAEHRSALFPSVVPEELALQAGKVRNLRVAAGFLDGLVIPAGQVFSFWRQVPRPTRGQGFVEGRELREGCIIPSVGGGLCQLSNALYDAALTAGFEIVERHAHSRRVPGSMAEAGRDATVFWNYVDLRFRPADEVRLTATLTDEELIVRLTGACLVSPAHPGRVGVVDEAPDLRPEVESCESCGVSECFRHRDYAKKTRE